MLRRSMLLGVGLLMVGYVGVARAAGPCEADVGKLCGQVPLGGGRVQACLQAHEAEISEACRTSVDALAQEVKLLAVVCRWDIGRICSDVAPGGGRVLSCLQKNSAQLSPECAKQLNTMSK